MPVNAALPLSRCASCSSRPPPPLPPGAAGPDFPGAQRTASPAKLEPGQPLSTAEMTTDLQEASRKQAALLKSIGYKPEN